MTDYVKSTNFTSKDSLASGNPLKIVKGTEFDIEFNNIATAVASKADTASPAFSGTPTAPTAAPGTNTTQLATTAFVTAADTVAVAAAATAADAAYPTKSGAGATGTWGISISGNAATATNATTASNGGVTSVNGLTGAVSISTSPSTSQVLSAYAGAGHDGVGTYTVAWNNSTSSVSSNGTIAGSNLRCSTTAGSMFTISLLTSSSAQGTALSGTWKNMGGVCLGRTVSGSGTVEDPFIYTFYPSLWLRIS